MTDGAKWRCIVDRTVGRFEMMERRNRSLPGALVVWSAVLVVGFSSACVGTAYYPIRTLESREVVVSGTVSGSHDLLDPVPYPQVSVQTLYGVGSGDVGLHGSIDSYVLDPGPTAAQSDATLGLGAWTAGGSYRHYVNDWFRVGFELNFHHSAKTFGEGWYPPAGQEPRCDTYCPFDPVDDYLAHRLLGQFAHDWKRVAVHGGPVVNTGIWFPDRIRPRRDPETDEPIVPDWLGVFAGAFGGVAYQPSESVSIQLEVQLKLPVYNHSSPRDSAADNYLYMNALRPSISLHYTF